VKFPLFKQNGKPFEYKPEKPEPKEEPKKSLWDRIKEALIKHKTYSEDLLEVKIY